MGNLIVEITLRWGHADVSAKEEGVFGLLLRNVGNRLADLFQ